MHEIVKCMIVFIWLDMLLNAVGVFHTKDILDLGFQAMCFGFGWFVVGPSITFLIAKYHERKKS